jgi:hypothetical protein
MQVIIGRLKRQVKRWIYTRINTKIISRGEHNACLVLVRISNARAPHGPRDALSNLSKSINLRPEGGEEANHSHFNSPIASSKGTASAYFATAESTDM